jgi:hypothetical protein
MKADKPKTSVWARVFVNGVGISAAIVFLTDWLFGRKHDEAERTHSNVRFEESDVNPRYVVLTGVGVLVFMYVAAMFVYLPFKHFSRERAKQSPPPLPITAQAVHGVYLPPEPRLQQDPESDLAQYMAAANEKLNSYGWIDRKAGVVSIPINQAVDLIVQRGIAPQEAAPNMFYRPQAGTLESGLEGKVEPEPR